MRPTKSCTASSLMALASESIRSAWRILAKPRAGASDGLDLPIPENYRWVPAAVPAGTTTVSTLSLTTVGVADGTRLAIWLRGTIVLFCERT